MSLDVRMSVKDSATPALMDKMSKIDPERLALAILPPLREHWRDHLAAMPRNQRGYPSTGFWEGAARSVEQNSFAAGGTVYLRGSGPPGRPGLRQRYLGGTISAVNHANITIPICAEAYGTTVKDWGMENLVLVILADGRKFYALWLGGSAGSSFASAFKGKWHRAETTVNRAHKFSASVGEQKKPEVIMFRSGGSATGSRAERHANLKFLFRLMPSVDQEPNEDVVPDDLAEVAVAAAEEAVK